jgi:uncharacterized protein YndB with AHSA1/START domain
MAHIEGEVTINRPVSEVFDFVADERNEPRYNPRMIRVEKTSADLIGRGARFRATTKALGGRTTDMTIQFTEFERPVRLASLTQLSSMEIRGTLTFQPVDGATLMRWSWDVEPHGLMKLVASPLIAAMGRRQETAIWAGLKLLLEEHRS